MTATTTVTLERGKIVIAGRIRVVPQRSFLDDWNDVTGHPPRSLDIAPVVNRSASVFLVPLLPDEAVWLGLEAVDKSVVSRLRAYPESGPVAFADTRCPPAYAVKGIPEGDGYRPFGRSGPGRTLRSETVVLLMSSRDVTTQVTSSVRCSVVFVDSTTFVREGGREPVQPLDRSAGYGGWRLP